MGNMASAISNSSLKRYHGKWTKMETKGDFQPTYAAGVAVIGRKIFVFGGFTNSGDTNTLYIFDIESKEWKKPLVTGELPSARSFHSLSVVGNCLYLFGGYSKSTRTTHNDLYVLDTEKSYEWKIIQSVSNPVIRHEHTAAVIKERYIYIFGGANPNGWRCDVCIFDTVKKEWQVPKFILARTPSRRSAHCATVFNDKMVVFGGYTAEKTRVNDVHMLQKLRDNLSHTDGLSWVQPHVTGDIPSPRASSTIDTIDQQFMLMFGGYTNAKQRTNNVFMFNLTHMQVTEVITGNIKPCERSYHKSCVIGRRLYIIGGFTGIDILNDVWYLDIEFVPHMDKKIGVPGSTLADTYGKLVNQEKYSDVSLVFDDGKRLFAHRVILCSRSLYFKALLEEAMLESNMEEIHIRETDSSLFLQLLEHIYSEHTELNEENVVELFKIAHRYGDTSLQRKCEIVLESALDISNVCQCFSLATTFFTEELRQSALNYIVIHFKFLADSPYYLELPIDLKQEIDNILSYNNNVKRK